MRDFIDDAELTKAMLDWMFERLDAEKELFWATLERTREGFDLEFILSIAEQINAPFDFLFDYEVPEPVFDDLGEFFAP